MPISVQLVVLLAALLHASWNAIVKSSQDKFLDIVFVTASAAALSAVVVPFLPLLDSASWGYIAASVGIHVFYFVLIGAAYQSGDMGHAYPLMRGAPPLIVALASGPLIGEQLSLSAWVGVLLVCAGILGLLLAKSASLSRGRTTRLALLNAGSVAAYTLVDGTGVRLSGNPAAYTMWMFFLTAFPILAWAGWRRKAAVLGHLRVRWYLMLAGGACTLGSYTLVLWAMTHAPIAMVAALRETAIAFGIAISMFVLREPGGIHRLCAVLVILLGAMSLKF